MWNVKSVIKRSGEVVGFDIEKIVRAISHAVYSAGHTDLIDRVRDVAEKVASVLPEKVDVEYIQDEVELALINEPDFGYVARDYVIYRHTKSGKKKGTGLLSDAFISKYKHLPNPFPTELGAFVYYRTYSRFLNALGRREYWWETVKRAVEFNCSIAPCTVAEAELLYDNIFNLRQFLSGRTLWVGGETVSTKFPLANFNCAMEHIQHIEDFAELFYLLLIGTGVGVNVHEEYVAKLPKFRTDLKIVHAYYAPVPKSQRAEFTSVRFEGTDTVTIVVGDSKESWTSALESFLKIATSPIYRSITTVVLNYNSVRPKGERLKTFGGQASGHEALSNMFMKIDGLLKGKQGTRVKLSPLDVLDLCNIIGENVVSGGK